MMISDIGILNFDDTRYSISEPNDIFWYRERYDFGAVLFTQRAVTCRERFLTVCDELSVKPVYGLRLRLKSSVNAEREIEAVICPIRRDDEVIGFLSERADNGRIALDDVLSVRDSVRIGLTIGEEHLDFGSVLGVCRYIVRPDFVFIRYDALRDKFSELYKDGDLIFMEENGIVPIPLRTDQREHWQLVFEDVEDAAKKGREEFLKLFG